MLDLTTVIMGPLATQVLGDLGAEVIKVETGAGDTNRFMGGGPHPELSGIALNINRNKRAVSLDVKHPDGMTAFLRILDTCDVFVTNLRPGALARLGIAYHDIGPERPDLVYCHAQGFRAGTPEEDRPAYDDIVQAAVGLPRLSEATVGETSFVPSVLTDKVAGQTIVTAVLAALLHRERTGRGQRVEIPMFDAALAFTLVEHLSRSAIPGEPSGYSRIMTASRGPHRTSDGHIAVMPYTDEHWRRLFAAVSREELLQEPSFADHNSRLLNADRVYGQLANILIERTTAEWLRLCDTEGIPANAIPSLNEIVEDPVLHRGMITLEQHPVIGQYRSVGPGMILAGSPLTLRRPAPLLAEHTAEVLAEVGYDEGSIAAMVASGAVQVRPDKQEKLSNRDAHCHLGVEELHESRDAGN